MKWFIFPRMEFGDGSPLLSAGAKRGRPKGSNSEVQALEVQLPNRRRKDTPSAVPMPVKKSRPAPGLRKAGRPKKAVAAAPSLPEAVAPSPLPNLPPSSSSTRPKVYLLGKLLHPITPLGYAKLPKIGKVIQKAFGGGGHTRLLSSALPGPRPPSTLDVEGHWLPQDLRLQLHLPHAGSTTD